jgi:hypothetical protein
MRTITEKYNAVLEGKFSKAQFKSDVIRELPNLVSKFNDFETIGTILKSKGIIAEKKEKAVEKYQPEYIDPADKFPIEAIERGIDYELEKAGIDSAENHSKEDHKKAKDKALKNLEKDPNFYLHLLSGDSKKVNKNDKHVEVKRGEEAVDSINGMKKATLKEGIGDPAKLEKGDIDPDNPFGTITNVIKGKNGYEILGRERSEGYYYHVDFDGNEMDEDDFIYEDKKELPKSIADKEKREIEKDAKKSKGMIKEDLQQICDYLKEKFGATFGDCKDFIMTHFDDITVGGHIDLEEIGEEYENYLGANAPESMPHPDDLNEALNKDLEEFGESVIKRLKDTGHRVESKRISSAQLRNVLMDLDTIPKAKQFFASTNNAYVLSDVEGGRLLVILPRGESNETQDQLDKLEKLALHFNLDKTAYGPEKDSGWYKKQAINKNDGDIMTTTAAPNGKGVIISFFRFEKGNYNQVKKTDKATGKVDYMDTAAENIQETAKNKITEIISEILNEGRGDMDMITQIIDDRAAESGFEEKEEAAEVIAAIAEYYKLNLKMIQNYMDSDEPVNPFSEGKKLKKENKEIMDRIDGLTNLQMLDDLVNKAKEIYKDQIDGGDPFDHQDVALYLYKKIVKGLAPMDQGIMEANFSFSGMIIKEGKNVSKMAQVEAAGRQAAIEAKLIAIDELITSTNESLATLEENEDIARIVDKNEVKALRKEVKLLEKMKDKLSKEKSKYGESKEVVTNEAMEGKQYIKVSEGHCNEIMEKLKERYANEGIKFTKEGKDIINAGHCTEGKMKEIIAELKKEGYKIHESSCNSN